MISKQLEEAFAYIQELPTGLTQKDIDHIQKLADEAPEEERWIFGDLMDDLSVPPGVGVKSE